MKVKLDVSFLCFEEQVFNLHFPMLHRCLQKVLRANVCHFLIFNGDTGMHMIPSIAPIGRNTGCNSFGSLRCCNKNTIFSTANEIPTPISPFIRFFDKKVRGKAQLNQRIRRTILVLKFISWFSFGYDRGVSAISFVHFIHEAILTTGTCLSASVPRIPGDCFFDFCILHIITPLRCC